MKKLFCILTWLSFLSYATAYGEEIRHCVSEPTDMEITFGYPLDCEIDYAGDTDIFRFQGTEGDVILIEATGFDNLTPAISLIDPDNDRSQISPFGQQTQVTIGKTGQYKIVIDPFNNSNDTGTYRLQLLCIDGSCVQTKDYFAGVEDGQAMCSSGDNDMENGDCYTDDIASNPCLAKWNEKTQLLEIPCIDLGLEQFYWADFGGSESCRNAYEFASAGYFECDAVISGKCIGCSTHCDTRFSGDVSGAIQCDTWQQDNCPVN